VTSTEHGDPARDAWRRIRALVASADVVAAEHHFMHDVGLTAGPVRALRALLDGGPQPMRDLAVRLQCDKSYVTSLVKPLVAGRLATLEPDPADGRVKVVTLTDDGAAVATRAHRVFNTPPEALTALGDSRLATLAALLPAPDAD
jgi:DNA-binding MarR family transcriptional regulator